MTSAHVTASAGIFLNPAFYDTKKDFIDYAQRRIDPEKSREIIQNNKGLADESRLEKAFEVSDYSSVARAIWSERDRQKRLDWLRSWHQRSFHVIVMFELALAELKNQPTPVVFNTITYPLMKAAVFRMEQDLECYNDPHKALPMASENLLVIYNKALAKLVQTEMNISLETLLLNDPSLRNAECNARIFETAKKSFFTTSPLPSPVYMDSFTAKAHRYGQIKMNEADLNPERVASFIASFFERGTYEVIARLTSLHPKEDREERRKKYAFQTMEKLYSKTHPAGPTIEMVD